MVIMMNNLFLKYILFITSISSLILLFSISCQPEKKGSPGQNKLRGFIAKEAMVVSAHPLATKAGVGILRRGGNAIDAAIAVQFALAVVYPSAGNIGGGGFMVIREDNGRTISLDFREKAPIAAHRNMFLDAEGDVIKDVSRLGHLSAGVPGTVDGMSEAFDKFGTMEWKELVQPAIDLAINGFPLTRIEAAGLNTNRDVFLEVNTIQPEITLVEHWDPGDTIYYPDLGKTLIRIRDMKKEGFYQGETANLLVAEMQRGGGLITHEDLNNYQAIWRDPVIGFYRNHKIISMGPPSSGGIALIQILQMLEQFPVSRYDLNAPDYIHLLAEAEKRVYADRARYLGDGDFIHIPQKELLDPAYNRSRMIDFSEEKAKPSAEVFSGEILTAESMETTHFSIVDPYGNAVAVTTTLNGGYGSKVFVAGAGFLLNNEMDDFSIKPGIPNMYGLTGGEANAIEPGKRMLSSMTPTILEKEGELFMVIGSPGGSRIITSVLQSILNVIEFDLTMQQSVAYKRFHHQWKPDHIVFERGRMNDEAKEELLVMGHKLTIRGPYSRVDAILVLEDGSLEGGADPRGDDLAFGY
jgi:gamma-glutamyltranspeptidase/glutathione hydrolase